MLTRDKAEHIFSRVRKFSSADEVEILIAGGRHSLTRFANNTITQNVSEENYLLSIRSVMGGRTARATTNKWDDNSLKRAVQSSETLARVQQPDPDLLPVPGPEVFREEDGPPVGRTFFETASMDAAQRADAVHKMVSVAKRHQLTAAGICANSETVEAVLNSRGLATFHSQTSSEMSVTMLADDSSGWQKANSPDVRCLDPVQLAETAARKALDSAHPRELPPGKYTVVLEPAAVLDLVGFMFWDWGGQAILDERSFLLNRVGTKLFGDNVNIWDDVYHPLQSGSPFDGEGVRRRRLPLVENGVVTHLVYARATAEKIRKSRHAHSLGKVEPTGHGFPLPNEIGEAPANIVFHAPGDGRGKTLDAMVSSLERGILVTRLWYIREVDPYEKILTGMTRDGTFYVENGRVRHGLRNFRFNESLIHMLANVVEMGTPVRASGEESFDMVVPPMTVRDFNFTEVTRF
ncbi:MAG: TldD/PmbA family protein [Terriglobales bacterium]